LFIEIGQTDSIVSIKEAIQYRHANPCVYKELIYHLRDPLFFSTKNTNYFAFCLRIGVCLRKAFIIRR